MDTEHNGKGNVMFGSNNTIMNPGPLVSGTGDDNTYNNKTRNYSGYSTVMGTGNNNSQWGAVVEGYYNANYAGGNFKGCKFLTSKEDFISSIPNSTGGYARERYSTAWELLFTEKKLFSSVQNTFALIEPYEMKWLFCEPNYTTMTLKCYDEYGNQFLPMNYSGSKKGTRCDVVKLVDNNDGTFNAVAMNGSDYLNNDASFSKNFSDAIWNLKINKNDRTFDYMDFWNKYNQNHSHIEGEANYNFGRMNHIEGSRNAAARNTHAIHLEGMYNAIIPSVEDPSLYAVHVSGINAVGKDMASFTWSGDTWRNYKNPYMPLDDKYHSHGRGTFNINPQGGINGFYIGEKTLGDYLSEVSGGIVTETDPIFSKFVNNDSSISFGKNTKSGTMSVAIGTPLPAASTWSTNYVGYTEAKDRSVAIGDSAKAKESVSVAIGNQANVNGLHGDIGETYTYTLKRKEVITETEDGVTLYRTNNLDSVSYTVDKGMFERLPIPNSNWKNIGQTRETVGNKTITTTTYEQAFDGLYDIGYMYPWEDELYNKTISSGQGNVNFMTALYGVAVGSRAYVSGYHGAAFGHYAHVSRPNGLAIGSESHVYSEGG